MFQKNAITVYPEYSYSGIVPKERALSFTDVTCILNSFSKELSYNILNNLATYKNNLYVERSLKTID